MSFRIPLGGDKRRPEQEQHYTEGYNAGYNAGMEEARRRGSRAMDNTMTSPDYERRPAMRQIGFGEAIQPRGEDDMDALMRAVDELKEGQHQIMRGMMETRQTLDPRLDGVLETATGVLENPPVTWDTYLQRKDYAGIAKMEGKELLAALEAKKPMRDIRKELTHTIAALFQMVSEQ